MGNDGTTERGFNAILEDLVKIALFMYINSNGVDQSSAQPEDHPCHELSHPILPTPTGATGENLGGSNLVAGVAL